MTYQIAAIVASLGVTATGVLAVHYRFAWHRHGPEFPTVEALSTLLLVFGGVVSPPTSADYVLAACVFMPADYKFAQISCLARQFQGS